jgi:4'-phosphopantetheinyl transferase
LATAIEELPADECHLWIAKMGSTLPADRVVSYQALLTAEEDRRYRAFYYDRHRHLYLLTRAVARTTLSRYRAVEPARWRFRENAWGKPEISEPEIGEPVRFNLSNAEGMVVCLVARDFAVGVDVETTTRLDEPTAIAQRFFSAREVDDLRALPEAEQRERFFAYWTLKESYIKARGMGLAIPLGQFSFLLGERSIGIEFDPRLGDDPKKWQFARIEVDPPHALALAICRGQGADLRVRVREWSPEF